jgi:hypothetical protein
MVSVFFSFSINISSSSAAECCRETRKALMLFHCHTAAAPAARTTAPSAQSRTVDSRFFFRFMTHPIKYRVPSNRAQNRPENPYFYIFPKSSSLHHRIILLEEGIVKYFRKRSRRGAGREVLAGDPRIPIFGIKIHFFVYHLVLEAVFCCGSPTNFVHLGTPFGLHEFYRQPPKSAVIGFQIKTRGNIITFCRHLSSISSGRVGIGIG